MLTLEQRVLLWHHLDGWQLAWIIIDADSGLRSVADRMGGRAWPSQSRPEVPFNRTQTVSKRIEGHSSVGHTGLDAHLVVSVSFSEIRRWAAAVPDSVREALRVNRKAAAAERDRTELWCRCHWTHEGDPRPHRDFLGRDHYHPSDSEELQHREAVCELDDALDALVLGALGPIADAPVQLDLFEVAAS